MSNGTHLEYVASLVSDPDLKDAAKAAEETLRVKSRGTVHALGGGVAVNMVSSEELLQTWNINFESVMYTSHFTLSIYPVMPPMQPVLL